MSRLTPRKAKKLFRAAVIVFAVVLCLATALLLMRRHARTPSPWPEAIVVHVSASKWGDAAAIRQWHRDRGWWDIGYHAVILNGRRSKHAKFDPKLDGKIEPGRSERYYGSHCQAEDMNLTALGVCLVGMPHKGGYPSKRQIDALIHYCVRKCRQYDIPPSKITQHSDHEPLKPLCASVNIPLIRHAVAKGLAQLDREDEARLRGELGGRR